MHQENDGFELTVLLLILTKYLDQYLHFCGVIRNMKGYNENYFFSLRSYSVSRLVVEDIKVIAYIQQICQYQRVTLMIYEWYN